MERSKTVTGSLIICIESPAETNDSAPSAMTSRERGRKSTHPTLSSSPTVTPTLEIIEKRANADAQLVLGCVSIMRRFSGVAKADERNEKAEYTTMIP